MPSLFSARSERTWPRRRRPLPWTSRIVRAGIATALLATQLTACFRHVPVGNQPIAAGTDVSVGITDRGRVALAEPVGPGVRRIGGSIVESTDTSLVLAVSTVEYFDLSLPVRWAGERVEISREYVADVRERQLSRSRTWLTLGLVAAGAVAVSLVTLAGFGGEPGPGGPPDDRDPD